MNSCTIIMYHYVRSIKHSRYPKIKGLETRLFKQQIEFFKNNFNMVSTEQLLIAIEDKTYRLPQNAALLTFDDGYIDHFTNVYPVLKEQGIYGFFSMPACILSEGRLLDVNKIHFILAIADTETLLNELLSKMDYYRGAEFSYPSNKEIIDSLGNEFGYEDKSVAVIKAILQYYLPIKLRAVILDELFEKYVSVSQNVLTNELYMNWEQLKLLKDEGMHIGIHGYDHLWMDKIEPDEVKSEITKSLNFFDGIIDKSNWAMCYPNGGYNDNVVSTIKDSGCKIGFTIGWGRADLDTDNPLTLPRLDTNDFPPKSRNYEKLPQ